MHYQRPQCCRAPVSFTVMADGNVAQQARDATSAATHDAARSW
jgi:hypothetical protein